MKSQGGKAIITIIIVAILAGGYLYWQNLKKNNPEKAGGDNNKQACIQVITRARNPQTGEEKDFPTPCDMPEGWAEVNASTPPIKLEGETPQTPPPSAPPSALSAKTYKNSVFDYELSYPANWGISVQSNGAFFDLGPGNPRPSEGDIALDMVCLFATGFEGTETSSETGKATYGQNTFIDEKIYLGSGADRKLALRMLSMDYPLNYAESHSFNDDPNYFKDCKGMVFIIRKLTSEDIIDLILGGIKFTGA